MSGDNGKIIGGNGEAKPEEVPKVLEMRIVAEAGKPVQVHFSLLGDKIISYGFLKMAEKTLDAHYRQQDSKIIQPKGSMLNFVRKRI